MAANNRLETGAPTDETLVHEPGARPEDNSTRAGRFTFPSGCRPLDGYTIKRAIGRGGFGEVYYALSDGGKEVALKLITRNLEIERRGVEQCMNLKNHHLITIYDLKSNDEGDTFVIMEYVPGPSLAQILQENPRGLPQAEVRSWLKGLVEGVSYLHDRGIVHRDLKPANLFLEDGVVKIGDYGLSKAITNSREPEHSQSVGTCHYMAPEVSKGKYNFSVDIYAIGVILYEMISGKVPFDGNSVGEVISRHLFDRPNLAPIPEPFRSIVSKALEKDPNKRPQRVTSLLLPGDAPKQPDVRIIGDGKTAPVDSRPPHRDDVTVIAEEDSVMYIGPDTLPPRGSGRRTRFATWPFQTCASRGAARRGRRSGQPFLDGALARPAAFAARSPAPPTPPPAPVEPPPLPSARARVAELSTSLLFACPLAAVTALLGIPVSSALRDSMPDPWQLAFLFGMILLGTWGVLLTTKFWEAKPLEPIVMRVVLTIAGVLVGLCIQWMSHWTHLERIPGDTFGLRASGVIDVDLPGRAAQFAPLVFVPVFFGIAFGAMRWWKLTSRARKSRFRLSPLVLTWLLAAILTGLLPSYFPWSGISLVGIAVVTQLVSPWDRQASVAARRKAA